MHHTANQLAYRALAEHHERHHHRHGRRAGGSRGPRARRGDVRAAILALLTEKPMHGYEMLKEIEQRSDGLWRPSAGSIYPTLQLLEDEGLIEGTEVEGKRRFTLTEAGAELAAERTRADAPWEEVSAGAGVDRLRLTHSAHQLTAAVSQVFAAATPEQRDRVREALDEARRSIYGILSESEPSEPEGR